MRLFLNSLFFVGCDSSSEAPKSSGQKFTGYDVVICVVTHDAADTMKDASLAVAQVGGSDLIAGTTQERLVHDGTMQADHYCASVHLFAEVDGQALNVRVAPAGRQYTIEKVEVSFPVSYSGEVVDQLPYTNARMHYCSDGSDVCGTIEAWHDGTSDWWRFNVIGLAGSDGMPTAVLPLRALRK